MLPILLSFWPFMDTFFKKKVSKLKNLDDKTKTSIKQNFLSSINAIGTILLGLLYLKTKNDLIFKAVILYPIIFYIFDLNFLWYNNHKNEKFGYIIHHLAAIYFIQSIYLYDTNNQNIMILSLISLEISNLPLYYVYNFLKSNIEKNKSYYEKLLNLKILQVFIYGICRVIFFGYIIYKYSNEVKHQPILLMSIYMIFLMGIYWMQHQYKGYFKTLREFHNISS